MSIFRTLSVIVIGALLGAACSAGSSSDGDTVDLRGAAPIAALSTFSDCDELLAQVRQRALDKVGPYGLEDDVFGPAILEDDIVGFDEEAADTSGLPVPSSRTEGAAEGESDPASQTNVQEAGIDEPDILKVDGDRLLVVAGDTFHVIDITGPDPVIAGSVPLETFGPTEMFVRDDRVLLLMSGGDPEIDASTTSDYGPGVEATTLLELHVDDQTNPVVVNELTVNSRYVSARLTDETARVVVARSRPTFDFVYPSTGTEDAERLAEQTNRRVIEESDLSAWLPTVTTEDGDTRPVTDCANVHLPTDDSGLGTLSVLTVDMDQPLSPPDAVSVVADGETVYASTESLYVATTSTETVGGNGGGPLDEFAPESLEITTAVHRFTADQPGATDYVASGAVRGQALDQFSFSEHDGRLRVATTDDPFGFTSGESESFVTVLETAGDELVEIGQVGGLGQGERIFSVRFIGDRGYVVTFRQTDPLYVIDLADPAAPSVEGELKILGYSAYLHPLDENHLIGVGQDATETGATLGTQVSVFDVSNPADPRRTAQMTLGSSNTEVEFDHRAFLYWEPTDTVVLPISRFGGGVPIPLAPECPAADCDIVPTEADFFEGAVALTVTPDGIEMNGEIVHEAGGAVRRSAVVGDDLYTLGDTSLAVSDLTTFAPRAELPL